MAQKNWPCNPICQLCFSQQETTAHLLTQCNYAEAFWNNIAALFNLSSFNIISSAEGPIDWITWITKNAHGVDRRSKLGVIFSIWWHLWKERNRRIFDKECSVPQPVALFREALFQVAHDLDVS
jgi:hypothetical protein